MERNATKLRLNSVRPLVRQPSTCRSEKINMSRGMRPYNRVSRRVAESHIQWRMVADPASFVRFTDGGNVTARPPGGGHQAAGRSGLVCTRRRHSRLALRPADILQSSGSAVGPDPARL